MAIATRFRDEWLVRLLVSRGSLDARAVEELGGDGSTYASSEILERGILTKEDLASAVKAQYRIPFAQPEASALEKMALTLVPEPLCRRHALVPLKVNEETIEVLMANPLDAVAMDAVMAVSGRRPTPAFGLPGDIEDLLSTGYGSDTVIFDLISKLPSDVQVECIQSDEADVSDTPSTIGAPIIRLANLMIGQAVRARASDIHIEHEESITLVRYRIDGDLRIMMKVPKSVGEGPLVSRIKIMANLDVADRRRPQDGRAKLRVGSEEIGLRVSTMPTSFGEKAVLRILDQRQAEAPLEALGIRPEILARLTKLSQSNQGMLLITGPTGSGKTTTLYALLNKLKSEDTNTTTIEDPIEYRLQGINQSQVNEKAGLTFANILRSVLRQDPDVVLVGEIRDRETADIAFQAALTGHMVLSTLHTNDSVSTINRLIDMGVERFKMAPALIGVTAQRLARRLCKACRVQMPAIPAVAGALRKAGLPARQFKGKGCEKCGFSGMSGRIALTELLDLSEQAAREMLSAPQGERGLREEALKRGWLQTMALDALWHLAYGDISFEEAAVHLTSQELHGQASQGTPAKAAAAAPGGKRRVLIVDDNIDNRNVIRATVTSEGYTVDEAVGGAEAIEEIGRNRPDLVLLDLMMPGVDGFAVVKKVRGEMGLMDLPIIVLTAMGKAEAQAQALELGADDYITKPFDPKILRARIKALFRRNECA